MLKYAKSVSYLPDLRRSRPFIQDEDRARAAKNPPEPVPFHCKPWVDAQSLGWTIPYGFLTAIEIVGLGEGRISVANIATLQGESNQPRIVDQFAPGHFGIGCGYSLHTPPGLISLLLPANDPPPNLDLVSGVIESDWYPRQIFLVCRSPAKGKKIYLDREMPLARVVLVPRHEGLDATQLDEPEAEEIAAREAAYVAEEATTPTRWQAASGDWFSHLYKEWSRRIRKGMPG